MILKAAIDCHLELALETFDEPPAMHIIPNAYGNDLISGKFMIALSNASHAFMAGSGAGLTGFR